MMSFMGSSDKGFNEEEEEEEEVNQKEEEEEEEEEEEKMIMMSRSSGKHPNSNLSTSLSHLQHTSGFVPLTHHHQQQQQQQQQQGVYIAGLENKYDEPKQEDDDRGGGGGMDDEREHMFDKVVTPSDVGKLNRLVIPKQHAEKYFPLDSSSNEKGLHLNFEDRNGKPWRFRYSYWNSSQSYVMTKGWSRFVKEKKLDAGDIVSFQRGVGHLSKHRLFIDWRRRPPTTTLDHAPLQLAPLLHHHHHHHHPPTSTTPHYFSFTRSNIHQQQHYHHPPNYPNYPWRRSPGGLLLQPPPPPPSATTQLSASIYSRDHSQYLTMLQPSTHHHHHHHPHSYNYMTSTNTSSTVAANNDINPANYSGGPVMYLRSAGPQLQNEGVGRMMMMQMPRGGRDHEEEQLVGGILHEPFVFESVPVVVQGKAAVAAKRLRLFGVNMEYSPIEDEEQEEEESHHHHHHHECHILSTTMATINQASMPPQHSSSSSSSSLFPLQSRLYNGTPVLPTMPSPHLLDKGKASMSLDLDI